MKKFIFFARVYTCWLLSISTVLQAQDIDPYPNYVVIGAFANEGNAVFWTRDANDNTFTAHFEINPNRNLFYVYVLTTADRHLAFQEALKLRKETKYFDTWVYSGPLGKDALQSGADQALYLDPVTQEPITAVTAEQKSTNLEGANTSKNNGLDFQVLDPDQALGEQEPATTKRSSGKSKKNAAGGSLNTKNNNKPTTVDGLVVSSTEQGSLSAQEQDVTTQRPGQNSQLGKTQALNERATGKNPATSKNLAIKSGKVPVSGGQDVHTTDGVNVQAEGATKTSVVDQSQKSASATVQNVATKNNELAGKKALNNSPEKDSTKSTLRKATPRPDDAKPLTSEEVVGRNFYFQLFRASNNDLIEGEVDAIDVEKSRRMATYKANTAVKVLMPMGKSKQVSFVSDVFGYRRLQKDFDPNGPSEEFYLDQDNNLVIPFQLVRLQKGDIAIMYNVFFFKDAGVMRPESRYEVNNLLELLNENPAYKIVIHGHTNGNANGKILSLGSESENFYSLTGTRDGFGSAKKLSEERAEVMKKYLVSKGVEHDRMQIKAWGGKKPIHDKHAVRANENVRVEIEILSD